MSVKDLKYTCTYIQDYWPLQTINHASIFSDPMETLFTAAKILLEKRIHRLPIIDPRSGNTLYILTHKRILNHIYPYLIESNLDSFFDLPIQTLGVGTYEDVKQVILDVLNLCVNTGKLYQVYIPVACTETSLQQILMWLINGQFLMAAEFEKGLKGLLK